MHHISRKIQSQMPLLLIYIPTYNRLSKLKLCLDRLFASVAHAGAQIVIHVSDNCSTDGTEEYLRQIQQPNFKYTINEENLGGTRNILFAHTLSSLAEYTMIIGDDDYFMLDALENILAHLQANPDVDVFFLNSVAYNQESQDAVMASLSTSNWTTVPNDGVFKSAITRTYLCEYRDLFSPRVDEVLGGSIMCYAYRSRLVHDTMSQQIREHAPSFGGIYSSYPHVLNSIYSLTPRTKAMHVAHPHTVNFWHNATEWGNQSYDYVVTQGLGFILLELIRLGYVMDKQIHVFLKHYLSISTPAFKRLTADNIRAAQEKCIFDPRFSDRMLPLLIEEIQQHDFLKTYSEEPRGTRSCLECMGRWCKRKFQSLKKRIPIKRI